jgi:hypothetical protein
MGEPARGVGYAGGWSPAGQNRNKIEKCGTRARLQALQKEAAPRGFGEIKKEARRGVIVRVTSDGAALH